MASFLDLLFAHPPTQPVTFEKLIRARPKMKGLLQRYQRKISTALTKAEAVEADNVAEFIYSGTEKEYWDFPKDFPMMVPPFASMVVGCRRPSRLVSEDPPERTRNMTPEEAAKEMLPKRWGALITRTRVSEYFDGRDGQPDMSDYSDIIFGDIFAKASGSSMHALATTGTGLSALEKFWQQEHEAFYCTALLYIAAEDFKALGARVFDKDAILGPLCLFSWIIRADGTHVGEPCFSGFVEDQDDTRNMREQMGPLLWSPLLSLSMMNTKNVKLVDNEPPPKLNKKRVREGKKPLLKYKTLTVTPLQVKRRHQDAVEPTGIKMPEHIVRGHFGDYRDSKGLFGKLKGLFWFDEHKRGSSEEGTVVKDYEVKRDE